VGAWRKLGRTDRLPKRIPSLEQRAGGAGREIYALVYRHQSRVAAHPGAAAVRPLVAGVDGGGQVIHDRVLDPPSVNPAGSALALLWYAFSVAQEKHAALPPAAGLDVIGHELGGRGPAPFQWAASPRRRPTASIASSASGRWAARLTPAELVNDPRSMLEMVASGTAHRSRGRVQTASKPHENDLRQRLAEVPVKARNASN
jgi:hypothetical protein